MGKQAFVKHFRVGGNRYVGCGKATADLKQSVVHTQRTCSPTYQGGNVTGQHCLLTKQHRAVTKLHSQVTYQHCQETLQHRKVS